MESPAPPPADDGAGRLTRAIAPAAGALAFIAYLTTMNRTFGVVDCGELAACAWTLGIPHATGYPTLMLLGWAVSHLSPLRPILSLNILAAALTASSVVALTLLYDHLLGAVFPEAAGAPRRSGKSAPAAASSAVPGPSRRLTRRLLAALGALFTGFAGSWWEQSTSFEVYCLHALLLPLACWLFLRYVDEEAAREAAAGPPSPPRPGFTRRGFAFAAVLGLAFTNHMTTGLLGPAFILFYFWSLLAPRGGRRSRPRMPGALRRAFQRWLHLLPPFLLALVPPYLWLMARAATQPRFNWGAPSTPGMLLHHLTGRDYGFIMGHFFDESFVEQFTYFRNWLPGATGYLGLLTGLGGLLVLARRSPRLAAWSALIFLASVLYASSYNVNDIGNYFMGAVLMIGAWSVLAAGWLQARFGRRAAVPLLLLLVGITGVLGWRGNNERGNTTTEDFTFNMLGGLPPNAIVLTKQWDFWEAGSYYLQEVDGFRKDVGVLDMDSLHIDWYLDQQERVWPAVFAPVRAEADRVREWARRVRRGEVRTRAQVEEYNRAFTALVNALVDRHLPTRPVYMTYDPLGPELAPGCLRIPDRLAQRLTRSEAYHPAAFPEYRFRMWRAHLVPQVFWTQKLCAEAAQNRAAYEHLSGRDDLAGRYARLALTFDPGFRAEEVPDFPSGIERQLAGEMQRFRQAREILGRGIFPKWYEIGPAPGSR